MIYLPIDISPKFRLEPSFRMQRSKSDISFEDASFGFPAEIEARSDLDQKELGLGAFALLPAGESAQLYVGARAAYIDLEIETRQVTTMGTPPFHTERTTRSETSQDGYRIAPTIGFEYRFGEHFSIAAEAAWYYMEMEANDTIDIGISLELDERQRTDSASNGTDTQLIFRYIF